MNEIIEEQIDKKVISKISDLEKFRKENKCSFLAHMPVIKMKRETTKCRIVYLSNLSEKQRDSPNISHNTAMLSGPCLNRSLFISLCQMRLEPFLLVFDLVKAFLQVGIPHSDRYRLCFLWFKNAKAEDYSVVGYYFNRLPFGLKCSPFLLMISLYHIGTHGGYRI